MADRMQRVTQAPRGMHDVLPDDAAQWQALEARVRAFATRFGYREIRTPTSSRRRCIRSPTGAAGV
jgi:histidyl-tRNA synthetase